MMPLLQHHNNVNVGIHGSGLILLPNYYCLLARKHTLQLVPNDHVSPSPEAAMRCAHELDKIAGGDPADPSI